MDLKRRIGQYVLSWKRKGYPGDIPDEAPSRLEELGKVPSYRLICIALMKNCITIMKNDFSCLYMGCQRSKDQNLSRNRALQRYARVKVERELTVVSVGGSDDEVSGL